MVLPQGGSTFVSGGGSTPPLRGGWINPCLFVMSAHTGPLQTLLKPLLIYTPCLKKNCASVF